MVKPRKQKRHIPWLIRAFNILFIVSVPMVAFFIQVWAFSSMVLPLVLTAPRAFIELLVADLMFGHYLLTSWVMLEYLLDLGLVCRVSF